MSFACRFLVCCAVFLAAARGAGAVGVRQGEHPGFGRVVFDFTHLQRYVAKPAGDTLELDFPGAGPIPGAPSGPRNVLAIAGGTDQVVLHLAAGAATRVWRMGSRVVVDIRDATKRLAVPARASLATPLAAAVPKPAPPSPMPPTPPLPIAPAPPAPVAATAIPAILAAPAPPATVALAATRLADDPAQPGARLLLPFGPDVGAAAFVANGVATLVFDEEKPIDFAAVQADEVFGAAQVTTAADATLVRLKLPPDSAPALARVAEGWALTIGPRRQPATPLAVRAGDGFVTIDADKPGKIVAVADSATGGTLLVGTLRAAGAIDTAPRWAEFRLLDTVCGIVVAAVSDRVELRLAAKGFVIAARGDPKLAVAPWSDAAEALADAGTLTRSFDLPPLDVPALRTRLGGQIAGAARLPVPRRFGSRLAAAQTMLALGMDVEAGSVLRLAVADDPAHATDPKAAALIAIADLLAGRQQGSDGLDAPGLPVSDELGFWRALRDAAEGGSPAAAAAIAPVWPVALAYPPALRRRALGLAAAALAQGGQTRALASLLDHAPTTPVLDHARALAARDAGDAAAALTMLDRLALGGDRRVAAEAAREAVELRLARHQMTPAEAAAALGRTLYAWRGDASELALRLRLARLLADGDAWRPSLALLRETDALFPQSAEAIHAAEQDRLAELLTGERAARMAPLDLAAFADENAALFANGPEAAKLAPVLVDKLLALELPDRAVPILQKLLDQAPTPELRATLGRQLAAARLDQGDAAGAADALRASDGPALPPALAAARILLRARIAMAAGDSAGARAILADQDTPQADALRESLAEAAQDWPAAQAILSRQAAGDLQGAAPFADDAQVLLVRLAGVTARARDAAGLAALAAQVPRFPPGKQADLFRLLTSAPVADAADLGRSRSELALARAMPGLAGGK